MITAIALGGYATVVGLGAPRVLPRFWCSDRAPRRSVALLLILAYSLPLSAITGGLVLGFTLLDALARTSPSVDACADQLPLNDESPVAPLVGTFGLVVAGVLAARICFCLLSTVVAARLRRRAHAALLHLAGRRDRTLNATILEHEQAASYCLPGRPGRIVVTSRAIELLTADQLGAVLAHERAHLRGHHHLLLTAASALRRAIPGVRLLSDTDREVRRLVELIADDAAAREHGPLNVATALAVLGTGHVPRGALGVAHGPNPLARITRLANPAAGLSRRRRLISALLVAAAVVVPLALAVGSVGVLMRHCPPSTDNEQPAAAISAPRRPRAAHEGHTLSGVSPGDGHRGAQAECRWHGEGRGQSVALPGTWPARSRGSHLLPQLVDHDGLRAASAGWVAQSAWVVRDGPCEPVSFSLLISPTTVRAVSGRP
jgi:hypothetical protein